MALHPNSKRTSRKNIEGCEGVEDKGRESARGISGRGGGKKFQAAVEHVTWMLGANQKVQLPGAFTKYHHL